MNSPHFLVMTFPLLQFSTAMFAKTVVWLTLGSSKVASSFPRPSDACCFSGIFRKLRHYHTRSGSIMVHQSQPQASSGSGSVLHEQQHQPNVDYKEAIRTLNTLQSNIKVLERAKKNLLENTPHKPPDTIKYLARIGVTLGDVDGLNVIHVSGTKGKGSTCAFSECILRNCGLRTGLYSSPHIIAVRERIRINGQPLSEASFTSYFWEVYNCLLAHRKSENDMPAYFKFLTVMAFYVFLKEKVEVAIVEVGIGGQYDCTNVIRKPIVCGVTSLGLDHTQILGSTLDKIAWQKAGIFKPKVPAVTSSQKEEAMRVLQDRAIKIGVPLSVAPPLESHNWYNLPIALGLAGEVQRKNAAVAVQLVLTWFQQVQQRFQGLERTHLPPQVATSNMWPTFDLMHSISNGLHNCRWPGRHQVLCCGNVIYFVDGAHTPESMESCVEWFNQTSSREKLHSRNCGHRILLFNSTGDRSAESLLTPLLKCDFDYAIFCPNIISASEDLSSDMASMMVSRKHSLERCSLNQKTWLRLQTKNDTKAMDWPNADLLELSQCVLVPCIADAISLISSSPDSFRNACDPQTKNSDKISGDSIRIHVLVVGSLHLVGGVLSILDPELTGGNKQETFSPSG